MIHSDIDTPLSSDFSTTEYTDTSPPAPVMDSATTTTSSTTLLVNGKRLVEFVTPRVWREFWVWGASRIVTLAPTSGWSTPTTSPSAEAGGGKRRRLSPVPPGHENRSATCPGIDWDRVRMAITKINAAYQEKEALAVSRAESGMCLDVARDGAMMMDNVDVYNAEEDKGSLAMSAVFQREEFIGGVTQMLKALPQDLTDEEADSIRQALPASTAVGMAPRRKRSSYYDYNDGPYPRQKSTHPKRRSPPLPLHQWSRKREGDGNYFYNHHQQPRRRSYHQRQHSSRRDRQGQKSMPGLRKAVASIVMAFFWIMAWFATHLYVLAKLAAQFERRHRLGKMAVTKGSDVGRRVVSAAVEGLKDGVASGSVAAKDILLSECTI